MANNKLIKDPFLSIDNQQWFHWKTTSARAGYHIHLTLYHLPRWINDKPHRRGRIKIHLPENVVDVTLGSQIHPLLLHDTQQQRIIFWIWLISYRPIICYKSITPVVKSIFLGAICLQHSTNNKYLHTGYWLQSLLYFPVLVMQPYMFTNVTDW